MTIWIDKKTGTWGNTEDLMLLGSLFHEAQVPETTELLSDLSDSEISAYGAEWGNPLLVKSA